MECVFPKLLNMGLTTVISAIPNQMCLCGHSIPLKMVDNVYIQHCIIIQYNSFFCLEKAYVFMTTTIFRYRL